MNFPLPDFELLSLSEQIAQMLVVRASGYLFDPQIQYPSWEPPGATLRHWLQDLGVGGVILLGGSAGEIALRTQQLQDWAKIPLLLTADIEEGVGQRFAGATWFPPPMALGAIAATSLSQATEWATQMGATTAQEAIAIGLNWILAPVVDVNNNPQNPVINVRAFGETPTVVSQLATAFIRGTQRHCVLTTAKHFPGHGDTAMDSHLVLPVVPHDRERLAQLEYVPFEAAIAAHVDGVMSAHLLVPELDRLYPATLSEPVLTGELRQRLGFEGLIVTDALVMGAIANNYGANEAAVLAVEAGADMLMMPADPPGAIAALCQAVQEGRITPERIQASLERIWRAKQKVYALNIAEAHHGHAWEQHPPAPIRLDWLSTPLAYATAQEILVESTQCQGTVSQTSLPPCNLILIDDSLDCAFLSRKAPAIDRPKQIGYTLTLVDNHTPEPQWSKPKTPIPTLMQLFLRGNPFRGSADPSDRALTWLKWLLDTQQLQALAIYGSPYLLAKLQPLLPPEIPYGFSYGQTPQAQTVLLSQLLPSSFA
ncbi:beta-glucosidase [Synechococcales cyanobacterium C]|uniref:beta-N-acetylhexosaminidase n=1 Tax=Petrachloros mirabilis ULC683 TaxID=2781853 RepID=A0A8K1ZZ07_9CYAN|nr:glycoside hydrolase family 3 N-terminal domain-containing protein [Petrachloros mirabilis]NCJ06706.1 beta-glucosidase [Petrachloros mirabilis ULC683]